jgi:hypothetical protein
LYDPRVRVVVAAGAVVVAAAGLGGCRQLFGLDDTRVDTVDAVAEDAAGPGADAGPRTVAHLRAEDVGLLALDGDLVITATTVLDTDELTLEPPAAGGIRLFAQAAPGAPEVVVVDASTITVGAELRIRGARPVILVATTIEIGLGGAIDASADTVTAYAGGYGSGGGPGAGGEANPSNNYDPGAGGGGHGTDGAAGADENVGQAGQGGSMNGDAALGVLIGGSGGGAVSRCPGKRRGGAGGGAVQLTALDALTINGAIDAGGGGGHGGDVCGQTTGGAGGGAGGAIYLEAAALLGAGGTITANGGGGGGPSSFSAAGDGSDGLRSANPAPGGEGTIEGSGGFGGAGEQAPTRGTMPGLNGGGGGGAVGRIAIRTTVPPPETLTFSPAPVVLAP